MPDGAPLLELKKVSKRFGAVQALTDVDFAAEAGQVTALVGDNGAGKSTLIKTISGIQPFDSGEYRFEGKPSPKVVMINGSPTDSNAPPYKKGAHSILDPAGVKVAKEYDTPDWSPDKAQNEMEQAITALGKTGFVGVYAANDGTGGGAIAAMKGQGIPPSSRPVTGQDAELAAVQRILTGEQYMTVYKAIKPEAEQAAELAVDLVNGNTSGAQALAKVKTNNGTKDVPSIILTPIAVTKATAKQTIGQMLKDGFLKAGQLCTGKAASGCQQAGLT